MYVHVPGAPVTYFNGGGGGGEEGGGVQVIFLGLKFWLGFFGSMKDASRVFFGVTKKNRGMFLGCEKRPRDLFGYAKKSSDFFWVDKF